MKRKVECFAIDIEKPDGTEILLGQSTFNLLAIEELFRAVSVGAPNSKFGIAFAEGSDNRTLRVTGNESSLEEAASSILMEIGCGHTFLIMLKGAYPIQVLNNVKMLSTTVSVLGATGNSCSAIIAELPGGNALLGVADGGSPMISETPETKKMRQNFVRKLGYLEP